MIKTIVYIISFLLISMIGSTSIFIDNIKFKRTKLVDENGDYIDIFYINTKKHVYMQFELAESVVLFNSDETYIFEKVSFPLRQFQKFLDNNNIILAETEHMEVLKFDFIRNESKLNELSDLKTALNDLKSLINVIKKDMPHFFMYFLPKAVNQVDTVITNLSNKQVSDLQVNDAFMVLRDYIHDLLNQIKNFTEKDYDFLTNISIELGSNSRSCFHAAKERLKKDYLNIAFDIAYNFDQKDGTPVNQLLKFKNFDFHFNLFKTDYYQLQETSSLSLIDIKDSIKDITYLYGNMVCYDDCKDCRITLDTKIVTMDVFNMIYNPEIKVSRFL